MPLLELKDVYARYGPIRALHGVSLTVDDGEVVALLGANGAGKTTTLRSISSMTRTSGEIAFAGRRIARKSAEFVARLGIAHVPEGRGLFPELTVWENLRMGAAGPGRRVPFEHEVKRIVGYFPWIERRRDQPAATLSGGEQQMLALGRALISRPRLLMLDEPSHGHAPTIGASPRLGSSSISSLGRETSARPSASICCSPPESVPACCASRSRSHGKYE